MSFILTDAMIATGKYYIPKGTFIMEVKNRQSMTTVNPGKLPADITLDKNFKILSIRPFTKDYISGHVCFEYRPDAKSPAVLVYVPETAIIRRPNTWVDNNKMDWT